MNLQKKKPSKDDIEMPAEGERVGSKWAYGTFEFVEMLAVAVTIVIVIVAFFLRITVVYGRSMTNTLQPDDVLLVSDVFYTPKTGDVIVIQPMTDDYTNPIVKRVIATAGQTVDIDFENWIVTVDGVRLDESYVNRPGGNVAMKGSYLDFPYVVPEGHLFVMGDNRNGSSDSRSRMFGPLDERYILGKVLFRVLPFSSFGAIH